jgi:hypothetical protein
MQLAFRSQCVGVAVCLQAQNSMISINNHVVGEPRAINEGV